MEFKLTIKFKNASELLKASEALSALNTKVVSQSDNSNNDEPDIFDEVSFSVWFLFDVISKHGEQNGNHFVMSQSNLLKYENSGLKPFSPGSLRARVGGATRVSNRLNIKEEIFTIFKLRNEKYYKIQLAHIEKFDHKIDEWDGEYEKWLRGQKLTSPTLDSE